jgi:hypothetical protein
MQIESVKSASNILLLLLLVALIAVFVTLHLIHHHYHHQRLAAAANLSFHFPALCSLLPHTYQTRLPAGKGIELHPDNGFSTRDRRNPILLVCTQNTRPEALQF